MRTVNSFIGNPIERLEDLRFLRGRGEYFDDLVRPGMLHAAIFRSSIAHGRVRSIDVARARGNSVAFNVFGQIAFRHGPGEAPAECRSGRAR